MYPFNYWYIADVNRWDLVKINIFNNIVIVIAVFIKHCIEKRWSFALWLWKWATNNKWFSENLYILNISTLFKNNYDSFFPRLQTDGVILDYFWGKAKSLVEVVPWFNLSSDIFEARFFIFCSTPNPKAGNRPANHPRKSGDYSEILLTIPESWIGAQNHGLSIAGLIIL